SHGAVARPLGRAHRVSRMKPYLMVRLPPRLRRIYKEAPPSPDLFHRTGHQRKSVRVRYGLCFFSRRCACHNELYLIRLTTEYGRVLDFGLALICCVEGPTNYSA